MSAPTSFEEKIRVDCRRVLDGECSVISTRGERFITKN